MPLTTSSDKIKQTIKDYPYLKELRVSDVLNQETVYEEFFGVPFVAMLEKFIDEADMPEMEAIKIAKKLLKKLSE